VMSFAELARRRLDLPRFSDRFYQKIAAATEWLRTMVDPQTGDAPNLGANDGAQVLDFMQMGYRDFRPSVQLASVLFLNRIAYEDSISWNETLRWLGLTPPAAVAEPVATRIFDDGGIAIIRRSGASAVLRYPRFRFRPGHADALHVDLTVHGINHLRDGGSYSYNDGADWISYFGGVRSHNTVSFDNRDQMPRLGRFLYGDWLKTRGVLPLVETESVSSFGASYRDGSGASHARKIELSDNRLFVTDMLNRFSNRAVLRWRLQPAEWEIVGNTVFCDGNRLSVESTVPILRFALVEGWESRYYLQRSKLPVLEVEMGTPGKILTSYSWAP